MLQALNYNINSDLKKYYSLRENIIYDTFISIYSHLPKGKYYGEFGSAHTALKSGNNNPIDSNFVSRLNTLATSPLKNKILSIRYFYIINNPSTDKYIYSIFYNYTLSDTTLFKIKDFTYNDEVKNLSEYYQYIIYIKNLSEVTPFQQ